MPDEDPLQQMIDAGLYEQRLRQLQQRYQLGQGWMQPQQAAGAQVGNTYVAASPFEHLSNAIRQIVGAKMAGGALEGQRDLTTQLGANRLGGMRAAQTNPQMAPMLAGSGDSALAAGGHALTQSLQFAQQHGPQAALGGQTPEVYNAITKREEVPKFASAFPGSTVYSVRTGKQAGGGGGTNDIDQMADAIIGGQQSPDLKGLGRMQAPVRAALARKGYNQAAALTEWSATQHHMATMNGAQQERLRQAVDFTYHSLDNIEALFNEWKQIGMQTGSRTFNRIALSAAKQLPGQAGATAQALEGQINDLTAELGNVYMGGNSPTDHALQLAGQNLSGSWNEETFLKGLKQIRTNLSMRRNAMNTGTAGGSRYDQPKPVAPAQTGTAPPAAAAPQTAAPRPRRTVNGETREWDGQKWVPVGG